MKTLFCILSAFSLTFGAAAEEDWQPALPGFVYQFPRDHAVHPDYKTEWWYFTGNLQGADGHQYGYELTFFRQGVLPPGGAVVPASGTAGASRFVQSDFKFGHFAISDLDGKRFYCTQRLSRGAFGEAGFVPASGLENAAAAKAEVQMVRLEDWTLDAQPDGTWKIAARTAAPTPMAVSLTVKPVKPPVIEGTDGISTKGSGYGNASHYYSFTRLETTGTLQLGEGAKPALVRGASWFDHEWASNQLSPDQVGWDWFCFQFDDRTELMLYAMRRRDGSVDPVSSGTFVDAGGNTLHLTREQIELRSTATWHSEQTKATYPVEWQVRIPSQGLDFTVKARMKEQELVLPPISYWEGATVAVGQRAGKALKGEGYMELTGYAGALVGLQGQQAARAATLR